MPRKPIGDRPMSDAERQARRRAARAAGRPAVRTRRPADHRSRARRWHDTVAELLVLQVEYGAWLEALPDTLQDTATAEALPPRHERARTLRLLEEALRRDVHFISRHPTALFQCLWNRAWWYDCPEAAGHYDPPEEGWPPEGGFGATGGGRSGAVPKPAYQVGPGITGSKRNQPDASLDAAIFSYNGIDCIYPLAARIRCMREVHRVLRPGGCFMLSSHNYIGSVFSGGFFYPLGYWNAAKSFAAQWTNPLALRWYFKYSDGGGRQYLLPASIERLIDSGHLRPL